MARLSEISLLNVGDTPPVSSTQLIGELQIHVPMAGLIDRKTEVRRLEKQLKKLESNIMGLSGKLNNAGFTDKAPPEVVDRERSRLIEAEAQLSKVNVAIAELKKD